jgi:hypothetical protein
MRVVSLGFTLVSPVSALGQDSVAPPFSKLFRPPTPPLKPDTPVSPPEGSTANRLLSPPVQPRVVCGMTMIPVDPSFDANIRRPVPLSGAKFTIKTVKPPVCGQ